MGNEFLEVLERYWKLVMNRVPGDTAIGFKADKKDPKKIADNAIENDGENFHVSDESSSAENRSNKLYKMKPLDMDETFSIMKKELLRFVLN